MIHARQERKRVNLLRFEREGRKNGMNGVCKLSGRNKRVSWKVLFVRELTRPVNGFCLLLWT